MRINENPDIDFVIMCNAKYFVQSGGLSRLIAQIVKSHGGRVFKFSGAWKSVTVNKGV